jgi:hypothetical protein
MTSTADQPRSKARRPLPGIEIELEIAPAADRLGTDDELIHILRDEIRRGQEKIVNLECALITARTIGMAMGVLMTTNKITPRMRRSRCCAAPARTGATSCATSLSWWPKPARSTLEEPHRRRRMDLPARIPRGRRSARVDGVPGDREARRQREA